MPDTQWSRLAGGAGVAFAVVVFVSTFFGGTLPAPTESVPKIVSHYVNNRGALLFQAWMSGIAAGILFPVFLAGLVRSLRAAEGGAATGSALALVAGILTAVSAFSGSAIEGATAYAVVRSTSPDVIQGLNDVSRLVLTFIWFPIALLAATTMPVAIRGPAFPGWHAWASGVVVVLTLIASLGVYSLTAPIRPGGGLTLLTFLVFLVWVVVTSILMGFQSEPVSPIRDDVGG